MSIEEILRQTTALLEGHFLLSSGKHGTQYFQCARALAHPKHGDAIGVALAERLGAVGSVDAVVAPALGGVVLSYVVARALDVPSYFVERPPGGEFSLRRGFELEKGDRVVVVEDVVTTGGSVREALALMNRMGVEVAGIGCVVQRRENPEGLAGLVSLHQAFDTVAYEPDDCPACRLGLPIVKPGSRRMMGASG